MAEPVRLFSYGTLQLEAVQLANFGRRLEGAADVMPRYRQTTIEIADPATVALSGTSIHAIVVPSDDPADEVAGMVFEIAVAELAAADAYEVSDYRRVQVRLKSGLDAWVYVKA